MILRHASAEVTATVHTAACHCRILYVIMLVYDVLSSIFVGNFGAILSYITIVGGVTADLLDRWKCNNSNGNVIKHICTHVCILACILLNILLS